jgi:hypothetical protein
MSEQMNSRSRSFFAISTDDEIATIFGKARSITLNEEITKPCNENVYAFDVAGSRQSGILITELHSQYADEEIILAVIA